jgi:hypothetical protein
MKELVEFRRDRLSMGLAFGLPIGMLLIFGLAIRLLITNIPVAVQDFDRSPFSREFISRINQPWLWCAIRNAGRSFRRTHRDCGHPN